MGDIPSYSGDLAELEQLIGTLSRSAAEVEADSSDTHHTFQAFGGSYATDHTEELLATTRSVRRGGEDLGEDGRRLVRLLTRYVQEMQAIDQRMRGLRGDVAALWQRVGIHDPEPEHLTLGEDYAAELRRLLEHAERTEGEVAVAVNALLPEPGGTPPPVGDRGAAALARQVAEASGPLLRGNPVQQAWVADMLDRHGDNPAFADTLADALGVEGLMQLGSSISPLALPLVSRVERGIGTVLATTTRVPAKLQDAHPDDPEFQEWLRTAEGRRWQDILDQTTAYGHRELARTPDPAGDPRETYYGYERIISHLEATDRPASAQYLYLMTDDMITAEVTDPQKWRHAAYGEPGEIRSVDLLDRQLGMIAHNNPHAATLVMTDHFDYLMLQGEDEDGARPGPEYPVSPSNPERHGLTDALVAATTGRTPDADHSLATDPPTPEQQDLAIEVFRYYEDRTHLLAPKGDHAYRASRIGMVTAEHIAVVHTTLGDYSDIPNRPDLPRADLPNTERLLYQLALDEQAFAAIEGASSAQTGLAVEQAMNNENFEDSAGDFLYRAVAPGSNTAGIMAESRAASAHKGVMDEGSVSTRKKWSERFLNTISDTATKNLPFAGTATAKIFDEINAELYKGLEEDKARKAADKRAEVRYDSEVQNEAGAATAVEAALHNKYGDPLPDDVDAERYKDMARGHANSAYAIGRTKGASN
ncbi:hypothetical protein [Streptomyces spiramenti]|uniref:Uncharacterized protein n=1 Tax=Streptomyces spiramenti TaxID=2720606 RepID=A0ABX1APZ8_9ACTN|nr:hypothetical protein [Streptomyces spiramenti]NJP67894.1 hypothetical protein [Streptomyces spiramenti]